MYVIADSQSEQPAEPAFGMSAPFKMAKRGSSSCGTLFDFSFKKSKTIPEQTPTVSEPDNTELLGEETRNEDATGSENAPTESEPAEDNMEMEVELLEEERRNEDTEIAEPSSKKCKPKHFQESWKKSRPWVENSPTGMVCKLCVKHKKTNTLTTGKCTNYQTTVLDRHVKSASHQEALQAEIHQKEFEKASLECFYCFML